MLYEAMENGLRFRDYKEGWSDPEYHSSMTFIWRLLEVIPFKRLAYDKPDRTATLRWYVSHGF